MHSVLEDRLAYEILSVVAEIPQGRVASYGRIARLIGRDRNARLVGLGQETGSVEPGKCADLIVTRENPLEDLKALRHVDVVIARGKLYRDPRVKKIEKAEQELDKFL